MKCFRKCLNPTIVLVKVIIFDNLLWECNTRTVYYLGKIFKSPAYESFSCSWQNHQKLFFLLLNCRLLCCMLHSTDMFFYHLREWNSCIMKTRWLVICHVLDQIFHECCDTIFFQNELYRESSNTEYLTNIQIFKFKI